ncbi:helix-turn-helix transcriptional regulator [Salmonella enterica]|uniref:XRE family transcriptional regulator n=1 Tax=Salmonella enterica I TaxID=59201 RepID=A0A3R1B4H7_SALET|nr:helix-turn-helix transcriptional regulator [Salmonella enterica]EAA5991493.1 XRE family transcriptional regulator [Salmonella enterica subsp. enterica serovar Chester]EAA8933931.1 XRE family transcriptional regulator [Salmonella enterica subsp. enterica serovar Gaminara]EBQ9479892.1 XRE family transcriptional regulator [Salmonella enterica subsp. enterica serovar Kokomlemle]EBY7078014.1 XRE family transcriptional regulator [Salmonella enterica subsp. enterica serovar Ealing]ECD6162175.1 XRE
MAINEFGRTVRIARLKTNHTLLTMSEKLGTTPSYLSALETGRKKISKKWVNKIYDFFYGEGVVIDNLQELADISNEYVNLDGLSQQQKMLVAGFAKSPLTPDVLKKIAELLRKVND